jgi:phosphonoacetate hydrolase
VVPFILSHPLKAERVEGRAGKPLRNYDVFSVLLNDMEV